MTVVMRSFIVDSWRRNFISQLPVDADLDYCKRQTIRNFVSIISVRRLAHNASVVEFSPSILSFK